MKVLILSLLPLSFIICVDKESCSDQQSAVPHHGKDAPPRCLSYIKLSLATRAIWYKLIMFG